MKDTKEENLSSKKRTIIIKGVNPFVPIIDIYTQLIKFTGEIKKISIVHNPSFPGISLGIFQIDYIDHQSALNAIKIINEEKKLSMIEGNIFASFADISKDNLTQIMIDSSHVLSFENLNINVINALDFKNYLIQYLKSNGNSSIQILKLRQYSNKIVIVFNEFPSCLKEFVDNEKNYFTYKSKNIPIKPMIKPIVNIGKYKEKTIKLSLYSLIENDKIRILNRIIEGKNLNEENSLLKKKGEKLYSQIIDEERREQEREREEYNSRHSLNKKRERENSDRKRYSSDNESRRRNDDYNNRNNNNNNNDLNGGLTQLANLLSNPAISQILQLLSNQDLDISQLKNNQNNNLNNLNLNNQNTQNNNNQNIQNQINLNQNNQNLNNNAFNQILPRNIIEENNINLNLPNNNLNNSNIINQENNTNSNLNNPQNNLQNFYFQQPNLNSILSNNPQLLSLIQNYEQHMQQLNQNNIMNNPALIPNIPNNQNNPIPQNQGQILNNMTNGNPPIPFNSMMPWNYM